ncbi:hypothetical protein M409DRAFT_51281 [Zasmidium cellare ATCC 36951]|uniref:Heterokaryon incompatibility domain-containing protein n=1 Tax=Zasmidium cellare ATCC 36951 TaxID=1080233 RepID=A0A6A6CVJ2_ZASCE|nr:uncharacterized protein M409DRAFT_51281 [Zasmidium cellare ATCC 36951]KAF2171055.1 hypothetical protein M409DRAFT_51281 [Zasmidium cellare ATCC 36951]
MAPNSAVASAALTTDDGRCVNCTSIDFFLIFGHQAECHSIPPTAIRDAIGNEHHCPICRLLVSTGKKIIGRPFYVTDRDGIQMQFFSNESGRSLSGMCLGLSSLGAGHCPSGSGLRRHRSTQLQELNSISVPCGWTKTKDGIRSLPVSCLRFRSTLAFAFVGWQIVRIETLCLTLDNVEMLGCPGVLDQHALTNARTISDAMMVVSKMGERYLWVDRLCIVQDSPTKAAQLQAMDVIYGAALLTLVAADGPDANAGLRGITPGSRSLPQLTDVVGEDLALTVSCSAPTDLRQSAWSSRGWTCQEQLLSRKFLIFSEGQVMWQCGSCFLCEDTEAANKAGSLTRLDQVQIDTGVTYATHAVTHFTQPTHLYRPKIFSQYSSIVRGFTKRQLTYQDDLLPAFQGFGSILERSFNCNFIAGLPEAYLDQALLWLPGVMQKRRITSSNDCPSWSWAGWIGHSRYDDTEDDNRERVVPVTRWRILERNGTGIGIQEACLGLSRTRNTFLWVPLFELLAGRLNSTPTLHHSLNPGLYLQFWTSCAFFRITIRTSPPDQNHTSTNPAFRALINSASSRSGAYAGHLTLNGRGPTYLVPERHEFVVVSEAQLTGYDAVSSRYRASEKCDMWNVLLVEWDERREVAYRVGVGRVLKRAWNAAKPSVKFINLG